MKETNTPKEIPEGYDLSKHPDQGIPFRSEYQKQQLRLISHKEEFQVRVKKLRNSIDIGEEGLLGSSGYMKWLDDTKPDLAEIDKQIDQIMVDFDIAQDCFTEVQSYILIACFDYSVIRKGLIRISRRNNPRIFTRAIPYSDKERLFIEIYSDTTLADVKRIWEDLVECEKTNLRGYSKSEQAERRTPMKNFQRDERIYLLSKENYTHKEIAEMIYLEFRGRLLIYDDIAKIVKRFKDKIQDA